MAGLMCPNCNHYNLAGVPYCQMCGASLSEKDTTLLPPKHSIGATPPPKRRPSALVQTSEQLYFRLTGCRRKALGAPKQA
jgi:hypothetical protein